MSRQKRIKKDKKAVFRVSRVFRAEFITKRRRITAVFITCVMTFMLLLSTATAIVEAVFNAEVLNLDALAENVLSYDKPASSILRKHLLSNIAYKLDSDYDIFQQASLPLGGGDIGAAVFGKTDSERIVFNEKTLWSGGPKDGQIDYNGDNPTGIADDGLTESERYYKIQDYLLNGDVKQAEKLFMNMQGDAESKGAYLSWGNIYIDFNHKSVKNYSRTVDIDNAVANVSYDSKGAAFSREYLVSNYDNVLAIRIKSDENLTFTIRFPSSQEGAEVKAEGNCIYNYGALSDNGLLFYSVLKADACGGNVSSEGDRLKISGSDTVYIYVTAATDYKQDYPVYRTGESSQELKTRVDGTVQAAYLKGYADIKTDHIADYKSLYDRVKLNLGGKRPSFGTDTLIRRYSTSYLKKSHRVYLEQLLYNYGRYLLISSSRANSQLPANLQGVWNASNNAPWQSDYHINVNLQMNYWAAYNTNLSECAEPLVSFVEAMREPGRITAKTYTATDEELSANLSDEEYGFVAHTEANPYGHTAPGGGKYAKALWSPAAVAWLLQNLYEKYEYGQDEAYLARIYPIMKEALLYFERTMVEYNGRLVTAPSYSPEHGSLSAGNAYEQSLVWQLCTDTISAAKTLGVDEDKQTVWETMKAKLKPIEIGKSGQIKEWYDETYVFSKGTPFHRHTSNLLGLFPGDLIDKNVNPEYVEAASYTLKMRGTYTTGWALGQRINTYARIGDGKNAYKMIQNLFARGVYANLFDAHPPFQIDGNFGYTSGVTEMLMQSNLGYVELLPASAWSVGYVSVIVARGNFTLSFKWKDGKTEYASVASNSGKSITLRFDGASAFSVYSGGNLIPMQKDGDNITFATEKGSVYEIVKS